MKQETKRCPDCGVEEGQLHWYGCDQENCGICGSQYKTCKCPDIPDHLRTPYIAEPWGICYRCGKVRPEMFMTDEWNKYVPIEHRDDVLCLDCFNYIKDMIDKNRNTDNGDPKKHHRYRTGGTACISHIIPIYKLEKEN